MKKYYFLNNKKFTQLKNYTNTTLNLYMQISEKIINKL